jgi:ubiquinone/menaquinone biosynthesis C-methylase UbiE
MVAKEGYDAYGIDISPTAIELGKIMLTKWGTEARLTVGSFTNLPYENEFFDVAFDVFSTNCLCESEFIICLSEVSRVLKKNGVFFSFTPSINSDAFKNYAPSAKIDEYTLNGIKNELSPYHNNNYPFRFISPLHYQELLENINFEVIYLELMSNTYRRMQEYFEFVVIGGKKRAS